MDKVKEVKESLGELAKAILTVLIKAVIIMLAWNYLMPDLFGLKELTFVQALALRLMTYSFISCKKSSKSHN